MIVNIDYEFLQECDDAWLSSICCKIISNGHYIKCDSRTRISIFDTVLIHGSSLEKELIKETRAFDYTGEQLKYLTVLNLNDFSPKQSEVLFCNRSLLLVENSIYEWDVYKHMADSYKRDRSHPNLMRQLLSAMQKGRLSFLHCGGWTQCAQIIEQQENDIYVGLGKYKLCALMDSDCLSAEQIPNDKHKVYSYLCGQSDKRFTSYNIDKIYTLHQSPYIWHMWYKRAIENYFPNSAYETLGLDTSLLPIESQYRDYADIESSVRGYAKSDLPTLSSVMSRKDYERGLKHFCVDGEDLSEIQLFLLKLVRII